MLWPSGEPKAVPSMALWAGWWDNNMQAMCNQFFHFLDIKCGETFGCKESTEREKCMILFLSTPMLGQ